MTKRLIVFCGFSGAIAVALGALGAHFLKGKVELGILTPDNLHAFKTGVEYQLFHTLALLLIALLAKHKNREALQKVGYCFMAGIVLFSGSLYILSTASLIGLTSVKWLGPITPIGGLFFIVGWLIIAFSGMKKNKTDK